MLLHRIFRPEICFKKWHTMVLTKSDTTTTSKCKCVVKCKYPPPSMKDLAWIRSNTVSK